MGFAQETASKTAIRVTKKPSELNAPPTAPLPDKKILKGRKALFSEGWALKEAGSDGSIPRWYKAHNASKGAWAMYQTS